LLKVRILFFTSRFFFLLFFEPKCFILGCYKKVGFVEERVLKKYYTNEDGLFMRLKWLDDEAVISSQLSLHREIQSLCSNPIKD